MGSKKQSDAAKSASGQQMAMFNTLNAQQQPFIQGGYGAMGKLNTLLGLGSRAPMGGGGGMPLGGNATLMPRGTAPPVVNDGPYGPGVRIPPRLQPSTTNDAMPQNMRLKQILALRAQNGDTEAARVLGAI